MPSKRGRCACHPVHGHSQNFGGSIFDVKVEEHRNRVKQLKLLIQEEQGTPRFSQAPFLLPKSGKTEETSEFPMTGEYLTEELCSVVIRLSAVVRICGLRTDDLSLAQGISYL